MQRLLLSAKHLVTLFIFSMLTACASSPLMEPDTSYQRTTNADFNADYSARLPHEMATTGHNTVVVNPNVHAWGAYDATGRLIRAGIATAGGATCPPDANEADCRTGAGTFHITSLGGPDCFSKAYPRPNGGGVMPYCMYFNNGQALHGSPDNILGENNVSHGCVRMRISDAEWMRYNFATVGTKVVVVPYD